MPVILKQWRPTIYRKAAYVATGLGLPSKKHYHKYNKEDIFLKLESAYSVEMRFTFLLKMQLYQKYNRESRGEVTAAENRSDTVMLNLELRKSDKIDYGTYVPIIHPRFATTAKTRNPTICARSILPSSEHAIFD